MIHTQYSEASSFLARTRAALEADEAANNLMLGISTRMERFPERIEIPPYLATVEDGEALVLAALMTPPHKLVVWGGQPDLGQAPRLVVQDLLAHGWNVPGVLGPAPVADAVADAWVGVSAGHCEAGQRLRVYKLCEVAPHRPVPGHLREATEQDVELVAQWASGFQNEIFGEEDLAAARKRAEQGIADRTMYLWEDGQPRSLAAKARPIKSGITVSLVYTPPEQRGKGYATACVAALSQRLLDEGWQFCTLFADLANPISNHIYQGIGFKPVCDFQEHAFQKES